MSAEVFKSGQVCPPENRGAAAGFYEFPVALWTETDRRQRATADVVLGYCFAGCIKKKDRFHCPPQDIFIVWMCKRVSLKRIRRISD